MRIFIAIFFTISLSTTFMLPILGYILDDSEFVSLNTINEEEEKNEVKLKLNTKDFIVMDSCYKMFMGSAVMKCSIFNSDTSLSQIYLDIILPPPEQV